MQLPQIPQLKHLRKALTKSELRYVTVTLPISKPNFLGLLFNISSKLYTNKKVKEVELWKSKCMGRCLYYFQTIKVGNIFSTKNVRFIVVNLSLRKNTMIQLKLF